MDEINANSTALIVTSPPYFAGKEYEIDLDKDGIPESYIEYLQMLRSVFTECWRILEPGGRIAINVANLGRKPYRSLSADITRILQEDIGFLLRGEIIWIKAEGASGSCAWGSFQSASNPVLRDVTERVIVASKLRFDRSLTKKQRETRGLPHVDSIQKEDFLAWTIDTWRFQPESAKKIGHPAPFPLELPNRLIQLYSYEGDLVVDPFCGAGTTALAAREAGRHYVGYDLNPEYISLAQQRLQDC
jgi:site-specific DNA-methyltransferase (adenine-specific)